MLDYICSRVLLKPLPNDLGEFLGAGIISSNVASVFSTHMIVLKVINENGEKVSSNVAYVDLVFDASSNLDKQYLVCSIYENGVFNTKSCTGSTTGTSLSCSCSEIGAIVAIVSTAPVDPTSIDTSVPKTSNTSKTDSSEIKLTLFFGILFLMIVNFF